VHIRDRWPLDRAFDVRDDLIWRWSEPHRKYHTLDHLEHCLREISSLEFLDRTSVVLAAWFHDAIYVTQPGAPNERESAELARANLSPLLNCDRICAMVLATEKHASTGDSDGDLFLDVDMCILGQDDGAFDAYEAGVRSEWDWVPDEIFREKRGDFVAMLLARESIFLSAVMREKYEDAARRNLTRSLRKLGR